MGVGVAMNVSACRASPSSRRGPSATCFLLEDGFGGESGKA
jgi:hypothetical protein